MVEAYCLPQLLFGTQELFTPEFQDKPLRCEPDEREANI